jgi:hypothetical protein
MKWEMLSSSKFLWWLCFVNVGVVRYVELHSHERPLLIVRSDDRSGGSRNNVSLGEV